jgi:hypothetical protein
VASANRAGRASRAGSAGEALWAGPRGAGRALGARGLGAGRGEAAGVLPVGRRSGEGRRRCGGASRCRSATGCHPPPPSAFRGASGSRGVGGAGGPVARGLGPLRAPSGSARGGAVEPRRLSAAHRPWSCASRVALPAEGTRAGRGDFGGAARPCSYAPGPGAPCRARYPHGSRAGPAVAARGACRAEPRACAIPRSCRSRFTGWAARWSRSDPFAPCDQDPSRSVRRDAAPRSPLLPRPVRCRESGFRSGTPPAFEALRSERI